MRDRPVSFRRLLSKLLGGLVGALVGVVAGIALAAAFVAYQRLTENERNPGAAASSVMLVIFTVPCGLFMGARYGIRAAGRFDDRRAARQLDQSPAQRPID